jgi:hypothetical protein
MPSEKLDIWEQKIHPREDFFHFTVKQIIEEKAPQDFIEFGGLKTPKAMCKWNPITQEFTLNFSGHSQITDYLNSQYNSVQPNNSSVLAIEDKPSDVKIEEVKSDEVIEQNNSSNLQLISNSNQEEEIITSLSLTLNNLQIGLLTMAYL